MSTVSAAAGRRIGRYSVVVAVLSVLVAIATVLAVVVPQIERELRRAIDQPWIAEEPLLAQQEADSSVWGAASSARIELPEELRGRPVELRLVEAGSSVSAFLGDRALEGSPRYLGGVWSSGPMPLAAYEASELWITSRDPWRIEILPIDPSELDGAASGSEDAVFVHRGTESSGTVTWNGEGSLYVIARTTEGYETLLASTRAGSGGAYRFEWEPSPFVVIQVSVYDGARWTIELDQGVS